MGSTPPGAEFLYSADQFIFALPKDASTIPQMAGPFDRELIKLWNDAKKQRIFKYELNTLFKSLPGKFGLMVSLNCERAKHRRKPHHFKSIKEPFDHRRFNFLKIDNSEILMRLPCSPPPEINGCKEESEVGQEDLSSRDLTSFIIINNSPISAGHSLLIPHRAKCSSQNLTLHSVKLATELMLMSSCRFFHIIFNSILGLASVNHLHLHLYYWPFSTRIIDWPTKPLCKNVHVLQNWMVPGFVVQLSDQNIEGFSKTIFSIVDCFAEMDLPYNIFVARAPLIVNQDEKSVPINDDKNLRVTFYIFPRKPAYGSKPITTLAPASCEMGGHVLVYCTWMFQELSEEKVVRILLEETGLEMGQFETYSERVKQIAEKI